MKRLNYIFLLFACFLLAGCEEVEYDKSLVRVEGLNGFYITVPGSATEYGATGNGIYKDGDTLLIKVPSPEEDPVDLSRLLCRASLGHNAVLTPALAGYMDFSKPMDISVTDGDKNTCHYTIKVELIAPKMVFKKLWYKNMVELGINNGNDWGSITVVDDRLLMCSYGKLRVYNKNTGEFIKEMYSGHPWTLQVNTDDAGHVVTTSWCIYGSYFECKRMDIDAETEHMLGYFSSAQVPEYTGEKVTVTGDVTSGTAYIYTTPPNNSNYYVMELQDGHKVNGEPIVEAAPVSSNFSKATVKRKSVDPDSEVIFSSFHEKESHFIVMKNKLQFIEMSDKNFQSSILDFDYFTVNGEEFVAVAMQSGIATPVEMRVFNISRDEYIEMEPGDQNYANFLCYTSESIGTGGYYWSRNADVSVQVKGEDVYLYLYSGAPNNISDGGVLAYHMKYTPQE